MKLELNKPAPIFELSDQDGKVHKLSDYLGKRVVLYFYPKDDTPGCTAEACSFRDNYSVFKQNSRKSMNYRLLYFQILSIQSLKRMASGV